MAFDLHTHSLYSDGLLTPEQLVERAKTVGLEGLALTDHDTVDGLPQFLQAGKKFGLLCLPRSGTLYGVPRRNAIFWATGSIIAIEGLLTRLRQVIRARKARAERILELLARHGLKALLVGGGAEFPWRFLWVVFKFTGHCKPKA